ncbi:fumarylacetoacetate hydrolase family protein [Ramlibacter sp. 2FC]|uniref:fumarylacetoacetate hydrolase family protein n=1 Tax=Ramlibacter sp. 2FC TaxID=2502188 RepID=UPI0010F9BD7F|nr:fumarylacetoacetate hydrolase family protein [Ramlibacter sp. 2FC]
MTPFLPEGTVYGTLLNFRREQALWAGRMAEPPYQAPPRAPVLYIKTANTFSPCGAAIALPDHVAEVEIGASLALVMGPQAQVAGAVLLNDLSLPHASYYRPPIKYRCLDGFLGVGPRCHPLAGLDALAALKLEVRVNGALVQTVALSELVRDAATLLADVAEFMSLQPGDLLMLGSDCLEDGGRPRARLGDRIEICAPGFEPLVNTVVKELA